MSTVVKIHVNTLPPVNPDGTYDLRYRIISEDRNQFSEWSDLIVATLPEKTVQHSTSNTQLAMSASSVTETVVISSTVPTSAINRLTFSWSPLEGEILDRQEYDLYAYFSTTGSNFNTITPTFLSTVSTSGSYTVDPTALPVGTAYAVFLFAKKTNIKLVYGFQLNALGDAISVNTHNVVTFVSPKYGL